MRIDTPGRIATPAAGRAGARSPVVGGGFSLDTTRAASQPAAAISTGNIAGIDALLALQAVDDPLVGRRKAVRRGRGLLDALEGLQADLLAGQPSEGRINRLLALLGQAREASLPEVDEALDEIELRARVELAKRGHFPAG